MYISVEQSMFLDRIIKCNEVALRCFVAEVLCESYRSEHEFRNALNEIEVADSVIYSNRIKAKVNKFISGYSDIYSMLSTCRDSISSHNYDNDVPYISELVEFILIFFNSDFMSKDISKEFSSVEEFHYSCVLYSTVRNSFSHPASYPVSDIDANKVAVFVGNILSCLDEKYFWYYSKENIKSDLLDFKRMASEEDGVVNNLQFSNATHKKLICRDEVIKSLYDSLLGSEVRKRVSGSVVLYGYGGVGKTAITSEFMHRVLRDKKDGLFSDVKYLLFFSSKDEYLRESRTTGELYIDNSPPDFSNLEDLVTLICSELNLNGLEDLRRFSSRGVIAIDNIENIPSSEKEKILDFTKTLPRNIQFIVTSRNEEPCEEKIHVEEFKDDEIGVSFVEKIVESENFNVDVGQGKSRRILQASKGNALIIVQVLNALDRKVVEFEDVTSSLESLRSKNSEMIANFMYKNTFDGAMRYLDGKGYPVNKVIQIISLYDERIELYSISKLAKIEINIAEEMCNYLLGRLVLKKSGEYYELNEFAKRFVFIKLLPDRFELSDIKANIKNHKERMREKLRELDDTLRKKSNLHKVVKEWQPRNYIDKIVIAEIFSLYGEAIEYVRVKDFESLGKCIKEFDDHSFITNHPYVPLQNARLLKLGLGNIYKGSEEIEKRIEFLFEEAVDSISYDYRYLLGGEAHASLLMLFGIFLCEVRNDYSRAIRFLEEAKLYQQENKNKGWFIICNYLSISYEGQFKVKKDNAYADQLKKIVKEVVGNSRKIKKGFDITRYKKRFRTWM